MRLDSTPHTATLSEVEIVENTLKKLEKDEGLHLTPSTVAESQGFYDSFLYNVYMLSLVIVTFF